MPKYVTTRKHWDGTRVRELGEIFESSGPGGPHTELIEEELPAAELRNVEQKPEPPKPSKGRGKKG